eukprot:768767-Hanusia_phi.AAC.1
MSKPVPLQPQRHPSSTRLPPPHPHRLPVSALLRARTARRSTAAAARVPRRAALVAAGPVVAVPARRSAQSPGSRRLGPQTLAILPVGDLRPPS